MTTPSPNSIEANATQLSYAVETAWGTAPSVPFNAIRYTSETLTQTKNRTRPSEINSNREAIQAVTTSVGAAGSISVALSYGTFDDFFASAVNGTWGTPISLAGVGGDIALTNTGATSATLVSTTANKFQNVQQGSWIRLFGFTNAANNGSYYVATKTDTTHLVLTSTVTTVTETPTGTAAQVRNKSIRNGTGFTSLFIQQKLSSTSWLRYAGAYVSGFSITGAVGQMITGSFDTISISETISTTTADTGGITPAPATVIMNPIAFGGIFFNETLIGIIDSFTLNVSCDGAALEYGMGSAAGQGLIQGTLTVTGSVKIYFKDGSLYANYQNEVQGRITILCKDGAGNSYAFQLLNGFLNNAKIEATGINTAVYVSFDLEGNPSASTGVGTLQIDAMAAT